MSDSTAPGKLRRLDVAALWLLCLAPIAVLPGLNDRWGWPTLLCVVIAALLAVWGRPNGRLPLWLVAAIAAVSLVLCVAALGGPAPLSQLFGRAPRYEGLVTLPVLVVAGWLGARLLGPAAPTSGYRHAANAMSVASVLLGGVAVLESFGLRPLESDLARPGSLAGNATDQGILGAIFVGVLGSVVLGTWRRTGSVPLWPIAGAIAGVVSVATSASRAGLLAVAIVVIALVVRLILSSRRRGRDALVAAGVVAIVAATALAVPLTRDRLFGPGGFAQQTIADRFYMWDDAWGLLLTRPWLGVGPSGFADAITPRFGDEWFTRAEVGAVLDSPHNILIQAGLAGGCVGLVIALGLAGAVVAIGVRRCREASGPRRDLLIGALIAVPAAGAALLTHLTSATTLTPLAMLVGLLVASAPRSGSRVWRMTATAVGALWLAFLLACTVADAALLDARRAVMSGDLDRALASFDTAQSLRPWDADVALLATQSLGAAVENGLAGAADPAEEWAERTLEWLPLSAQAQYAAGVVALDRADYALARDRLGEAARLSPADPRIHHTLGVASLLDGDPASARVSLERALELSPDSAVTWTALRDACERLGDQACAADAEAQRARLAPEDTPNGDE
ncbi:O-antigen ligase family protein [Microbacterium sp.]|uniref:O-antigen ligase family protein n=1 Tax=Microbacterium sp. TaxID=51671 RepID=UPI0039E37C48